MSEENTRLWNTGVDSDKEIVENVRENYLTTLTSMLLVTRNIQKMRVKFSCLSLVKKSLIRLLKQCKLLLKMKSTINPFDFWKVQTLN